MGAAPSITPNPLSFGIVQARAVATAYVQTDVALSTSTTVTAIIEPPAVAAARRKSCNVSFDIDWSSAKVLADGTLCMFASLVIDGITLIPSGE